jgi:hypothetical protein
VASRHDISEAGQLVENPGRGARPLDLPYQPDEYVAVNDTRQAAAVPGPALADPLGAETE